MKAINAVPQSIRNLFQQKEFVIPVYQRPYSWDNDKCGKLWEDLSYFLVRATDGIDDDRYFMGSIIVYPNPKNNNMWYIIDGQQRLTTLLLFLKAVFNNASTYSALEGLIYAKNIETDTVDKNRPRLKSEVLGGEDKESFTQVLAGDLSELEKKDKNNPFLNNYKLLERELNIWWETKSPDDRKKIISKLLDNVVLLPIECASEDDALTLFQIVNDRGMPLSDSDIFKAKLFKAVAEQDRAAFIKRWDNIGRDDVDHMFRVFMHISRAKKGITGKELKLREYIQGNHLKDERKLSSEWKKIMQSVEACYYVYRNPTSDDSEMKAEESIYWGVLGALPNTYWQYPLYVFLHKYMKKQKDSFFLPSEKRKEYKSLLQETIRYFFIKSVVHNSVNAVKETTFKVCADIAQGKDYTASYRENCQKDLGEMKRKLDDEDSDFGKSRKGLVLLAASLNSEKDVIAYGEALDGKIEIEHILPDKWNHYDKWDEESYKRDVNKIGNLMPLEKKLNIKAGNEFFPRKQKEYKKSKVQDALDLAKKKPPVWYPKDVANRHEESLNRLREFFLGGD